MAEGALALRATCSGATPKAVSAPALSGLALSKEPITLAA
eukprot:CAMPEP_0171658876 /NCGR_PEP_ID=MMETSP0990-20121206/43233_1 /TAXON_ID=483369 /ORGANISM="non described non described, Strain CCMP2098" /LENGTH=39 /DNA_ID= /DNA_START= /DNA_END= /DNA_ORIENTATION=